jgi:hypothetical protein
VGQRPKVAFPGSFPLAMARIRYNSSAMVFWELMLLMTEMSSISATKIKVIQSKDEFRLLESIWYVSLFGCKNKIVFLTLYWIYSWWKSFGMKEKKMPDNLINKKQIKIEIFSQTLKIVKIIKGSDQIIDR